MRLFLFLLTAVIVVSCNTGFDGDNEALDTATDWAEAYFNCDFKDAATYATAESGKWLRFAASNTTEEDLKLVNGGATVSAADYFILRFDMGMKAVNPAYKNSREPFPIVHPKLSRDFAFHFAVGLPF